MVLYAPWVILSREMCGIFIFCWPQLVANHGDQFTSPMTPIKPDRSEFRGAMPSGFPYHLPYKRLDLRKYSWFVNFFDGRHPELYRIGKGEQGVLMIEPYKSEVGHFPNLPLNSVTSIMAVQRYGDCREIGRTTYSQVQ
jgi:hypothetical protein